MEQSYDITNRWDIVSKVAFRFFFVFFLLIIFPFPLSIFDSASTLYGNFWDIIIPWAGKHVLHIGQTILTETNGSGDTTYGYVELFCYAVIASVTCIIWCFADTKRNSYNFLYTLLNIYIRYYLAFTLFGYGFGKIMHTQFPALLPGQLLDTYGHSSPMGLLWRFMSYSTAYNIFTGSVEIAGALLLLFRQTKLMGALIIFASMVNIVALNFCYDVPVKIYSTELLAMSAFLITADINRLIDFFIRNKAVGAVDMAPYFKSTKKKYTGWVLKFLLIVIIIGSTVTEGLQGINEYNQISPLSGIYNVETFVLNKDTLPAMLTDTRRWNQLVINGKDIMQIGLMNGSKQYYSFKQDENVRKISLSDVGDTVILSSFYYLELDSNHFALQGKIDKDSVFVSMKKMELNEYPLMHRSFHWVNEYPFNQ